MTMTISEVQRNGKIAGGEEKTQVETEMGLVRVPICKQVFVQELCTTPRRRESLLRIHVRAWAVAAVIPLNKYSIASSTSMTSS